MLDFGLDDDDVQGARTMTPSIRVFSISLVAEGPEILSASMAVEVAEFLMANVPPKPQRESPAQRPVVYAQSAQRVAGRVLRDAVRGIRADVFDTEYIDQQLGELPNTRRDGGGLALERGVAVLLGEHRVALANPGS